MTATRISTRLSSPVEGSPSPGPLSILGSALLFADYWAADRDNPAAVNPRITLGTGVSSWPEEATRNTALTQGTASAQPALSATSFGGRPGITFDGSADGLSATLSPAIAAGSRIYFWVVGNWTTTSTGNYARILELSWGDVDTNNRYTALISATDASDKFGGFGVISDGVDDGAGVSANGQTLTTSRSVIEWGLLPSSTGKLIVNGAASDSDKAGTLSDGAHDRLSVGCRVSVVLRAAPLCVHRVIIAHNPGDKTALPSASQLSAMRAYLAGFL